MTTWLGRIAERQRLAAEDQRRWLADRRQAFAGYLTLCESMLREIDGVASFLSYDGTKEVIDGDEELIAEGLTAYWMRWDDELQPALSDIQLLAGGPVADLADRVSGALMALTSVVELRGRFVDFYPTHFRATDLLGLLRNAMRNELGVKGAVDVEKPRSGIWPWLPELPTEEDYIRRQLEIPGRPPLTSIEMARLNQESESG